MFLRFPESYANETDEIKESVKHFRRVRDQWLAHVDLVDPDKPGVAYPSWHEDWRRFKKILRVSASPFQFTDELPRQDSVRNQ